MVRTSQCSLTVWSVSGVLIPSHLLLSPPPPLPRFSFLVPSHLLLSPPISPPSQPPPPPPASVFWSHLTSFSSHPPPPPRPLPPERGPAYRWFRFRWKGLCLALPKCAINLSAVALRTCSGIFVQIYSCGAVLIVAGVTGRWDTDLRSRPRYHQTTGRYQSSNPGTWQGFHRRSVQGRGLQGRRDCKVVPANIWWTDSGIIPNVTKNDIQEGFGILSKYLAYKSSDVDNVP